MPYRYAWRYRDYVIDAFNQGKPYDRFIVEQLAGDLLPAKDAAEHDRLVIATGFLADRPQGCEHQEPEQFRMDQIDDQIDVTGRALLGMTIACAAATITSSIRFPPPTITRWPASFTARRPTPASRPARRTAVDDRLLDPGQLRQRRTVSPDEAQAEKDRQEEIAKIEAQIASCEIRRSQASSGPKRAKQKQAKGMKQNPFVAASRRDPKRRESRSRNSTTAATNWRASRSPTAPLAMGVRDAETPSNCNVLDRGELENKGAGSAAGRVDRSQNFRQRRQMPPRHSGRLELARWIASKDNPLTARVMVNRVWEHLFGQGLVDTVDNFGALGNEPSHPALLDMLAVQFMEENWSVKKLIRSIVLSRIYQLSSEHNDDNYEKDPANKFLWRMQRRRLDAEEIRDAMLAGQRPAGPERPEAQPIMDLTNKPVWRRQRTANPRTCAASICRSCAAWCPNRCKCSTWPTRT